MKRLLAILILVPCLAAGRLDLKSGPKAGEKLEGFKVADARHGRLTIAHRQMRRFIRSTEARSCGMPRLACLAMESPRP